MARSKATTGTNEEDSNPSPSQPRNQPTRPKTTKRKGKEVASSSAPPPSDEREEPTNTVAPWPRPDNTPFIGVDKVPVIPNLKVTEYKQTTAYLNRRYKDPWDITDSTCYNGLLRVDMAPTKFVCGQTLRKIGIAEDVKEMLNRMGLGTMPYQSYPLYPELVRQFLASADVRYENENNLKASKGTLSYFSSGKLYEISLRALCDLYGFNRNKECCSLPGYADFPHMIPLWKCIAKGTCETRKNKLALIRNPAIRIVAKILGHTLFGKEETGSLRMDELVLLHYGLPSVAKDIDRTRPPSTLGTNLGAIFASVLVQKKFRGLDTKNRKMEIVGSLLTLIFRFHGIDLTHTQCVDRLDLIDEGYLRRSHILEPGYKYMFCDREDTIWSCTLPQPALTSLTSVQNIEFLPRPDHMSIVRRAQRQRESSYRPSTSQPQREDDAVPEHFAQPDYQSYQQDTDEPLIPDYTGEYILPEISGSATDSEKLDWLIQSHKKTHTRVEKILSALAKLRCPRPPSCFRASDTAERRANTAYPAGDDPDVAGHGMAEDDGPDVAGHGIADDSDTSDHVHRSRMRRSPGDSQTPPSTYGSRDDTTGSEEF